MNTKLKYIIILTSTLIIGVIIGFLLGGRITSTKVERINSYYTNQGFNREFMRIIKPTPEQRTIIMPILKKYAKQNHKILVDFHKGQENVFLDLKNEIDVHLNQDQLSRLDTVFEQRDRRFRNRHPKHPRMGKRKNVK